MLFPDSGDQNAFYLQQISQQLASFTDSSTFVPPQDYFPRPPTTPVVLVNAMWAVSLVFSLMSALSATSIRKWAHRYIQLPQIPSSSSEQARVRSFLFFGILKYGITLAVELTSMLLHLSVFLFFVGLVIFSFILHKTIAIVLSISVGLFGVVYLTLTVLPCIDHCTPYSTPMSTVWWYLWHTSLYSATLCLLRLLILFTSVSGLAASRNPEAVKFA